MWYAAVLVWIALIAGIIWAYNRKQRQRNAERAKQVDALLSELRGKRDPVAVSAAGDAAPAVMVPVAAAPVPELGRKPRLLPQPAALLYYIFRAGLPDHEIFAGLTLADVIEIASALRGYERERKVRQLSQQRLDLVVCTKQLEVVAAVMTGKTTESAQTANARFAEECLQAAGIRLLRIDPAALPRHTQVRGLVYGTDA